MDAPGDQFPPLPEPISPNPVNSGSDRTIILKTFIWSGVGKSQGTQLILTDLAGNEVWAPSCGQSSETHELVLNDPLRLDGVIIKQLPAGVVYIYKE
jgi:hypothetical protein